MKVTITYNHCKSALIIAAKLAILALIGAGMLKMNVIIRDVRLSDWLHKAIICSYLFGTVIGILEMRNILRRWWVLAWVTYIILIPVIYYVFAPPLPVPDTNTRILISILVCIMNVVTFIVPFLITHFMVTRR